MYCNVLKYRIFTFIVKEQKKKEKINRFLKKLIHKRYNLQYVFCNLFTYKLNIESRKSLKWKYIREILFRSLNKKKSSRKSNQEETHMPFCQPLRQMRKKKAKQITNDDKTHFRSRAPPCFPPVKIEGFQIASDPARNKSHNWV